jgi:hypothetical protein
LWRKRHRVFQWRLYWTTITRSWRGLLVFSLGTGSFVHELTFGNGFGHNRSRIFRGILLSECIAPDRSPASLHFLFPLQDTLLQLIDTLGLLRATRNIKRSLSAEDVALQFVRRDIVASLGSLELAKDVLEFGLSLRSSLLAYIAFPQVCSEINNRGLRLGPGRNGIS